MAWISKGLVGKASLETKPTEFHLHLQIAALMARGTCLFEAHGSWHMSRPLQSKVE